MITEQALRLLRRLARVPGVRRLTRVRALTRLSFALRASLVREHLEFVWLELASRGPVLKTHHIRDTGVPFAMRHQTADVLVLDELFSQREYELPLQIRDALAGRRPLRVLDLGANIGLFGAWMIGEFSDVQITSIEADPDNARVLEATIAANRSTRWNLIEAAASTRDGTVRFVSGEHTTSHMARPDEDGIEVSAVDVFELAGDVDMLKIDVEGAEWPLLADPRFGGLGPAAVLLEYHPQGCRATDARAAAEDRLRCAGLEVINVRPHAEHGTGLIWALGERLG
jgi:FkbM family methyltransferase